MTAQAAGGARARGMTQHSTDPLAPDPRLADLRIAVVGAGRIGGEMIRNLALMGVARIDVFESDRRAADRFRDRHRVLEGDFWDELTLGRLRQYDFAACTIDDGAARVRMNQKCLLANVNLLQAWTEGPLAVVGAYPFGALDDCACAECDAGRAATPLAALRLTAVEPDVDPASGIVTSSIAGALSAALIARIASGAHGAVARRAALDTTTGRGASVELSRDPQCARCKGVARPVPIVRTRNRWSVSAAVASVSPETLAQDVQLSDEVEGLSGYSFQVGQLIERFHGGPVPAKFALTVVDGRVVCLDFEDVVRDESCVDGSRATPRRSSG